MASGELMGDEKKQAFEALECACKFFQDNLQGSEAEKYMKDKRGFTPGTLNQFRIGYAPDSWDALKDHLFRNRFEAHVLQTVGLVNTRENGGYYSFFKGRIMFPYFETLTGRVIGFAGRAMTKAEEEFGKYRNSRATPLFKKGNLLYGLNFAQEAINKKKKIILLEGYTDVMMAHQTGVKNSVALVGVELTDEHLAVLNRHYPDCDWVACTDADSAGINAAMKVVHKTKAAPNIKVCTLPKGTDDPARFIQDGGNFGVYLDGYTEPGFSFYVHQMREEQEVSDAGSELKFLQKMEPLMLSVEKNYRPAYVDVLSRLTGIRRSSICSFFQRRDPRYQRPAEDYLPQVPMIDEPDPIIVPPEMEGRIEKPEFNIQRRLDEENFIRTLVAYGTRDVITSLRSYLKPEHFSDGEARTLYNQIISRKDTLPLLRGDFPLQGDSRREILESIVAEVEGEAELAPDLKKLKELTDPKGVPQPSRMDFVRLSAMVVAHSVIEGLRNPEVHGVLDVKNALVEAHEKMR